MQRSVVVRCCLTARYCQLVKVVISQNCIFKAIDFLLFFYTLPLRFVLVLCKSVRLFLNFCRFSSRKYLFSILFWPFCGCENCLLSLIFWASSVFFYQPFAKALSLVFYLESAMFYNKEKVALFGIRLNIKEIE